MVHDSEPIIVKFPLRGERWVAVNSPGDRVPSHGTDMLGQRYAYDFLQVDARSGIKNHPGGTFGSLLFGYPTETAYAWGDTVHAPIAGEIVETGDGFPERPRVNPLADLARALKMGATFEPSRLREVLGNYVLMRSGGFFAGFAHLVPGSVTVATGAWVEVGEPIGKLGHTGNSTAPHLHFQLMDSADILTAHGIPCVFESYEVLRGKEWVEVREGMPKRTDRIRFLG